MLVLFRVLQAVGAAAVIPTALTLLMAAFPEGRQGLAAGLFGTASTLAAALGPTLGGLLIRQWSWPAIFVFNLPVGVLGLVLAALFLPRVLAGRRGSRWTCPASPFRPRACSA